MLEFQVGSQRFFGVRFNLLEAIRVLAPQFGPGHGVLSFGIEI